MGNKIICKNGRHVSHPDDFGRVEDCCICTREGVTENGFMGGCKHTHEQKRKHEKWIQSIERIWGDSTPRVYAVSTDEDWDKIIYVGSTIGPLCRRFLNELYSGLRANNGKRRRILKKGELSFINFLAQRYVERCVRSERTTGVASMVKLGVQYHLVGEYPGATNNELRDREQEAYDHYRKLGHPLFNIVTQIGRSTASSRQGKKK